MDIIPFMCEIRYLEFFSYSLSFGFFSLGMATNLEEKSLNSKPVGVVYQCLEILNTKAIVVEEQ